MLISHCIILLMPVLFQCHFQFWFTHKSKNRQLALIAILAKQAPGQNLLALETKLRTSQPTQAITSVKNSKSN